ncbi:hypothetical protein [Halobacteriovorax sp. JY17]|uniref:hypothetical protein n=1 Tax=Halobacteriovorax sp. JY17 TaxID=2014617 RepID=UPI000C472DBA|nr:hypothetical protein [Halobacteriovorax sp. JY17]PIK15043.1 MAG: hypothetical protein CES88_11965 [Halobacteriovorax sp. JY17]
MSTSNEINHTTDSEIKIDSKNLTRIIKRSAAPSLSVKPSRSFNRVKSLRPRTAVGIKKTTISIEEFQDK